MSDNIPPKTPPSLADALRVVAEAAQLDVAAARLGLTSETLANLLREGADALAWAGPPRRPAAPRPEIVAPPTQHAFSDVLKMETPSPRAPPPTVAKHTTLTLFSDGAARGNPGPAGAGAVLKAADGAIVARVGKFLGVQTNNVAEYEGVLIGLQRALDMGVRVVHVRADSLLVISQLRGEWKIKNEGLKPLYEQAKRMLRQFERVTLQHVPRAQNSDADEMSNRAIDERM